MRVVLFCHSLISDWNHGNAHFLRGIVSELMVRGHDVKVFEPADAWSLQNLIADHGRGPLELFRAAYPQVHVTRYDPIELDLETVLDGAGLVLVHEWNSPALIRDIGRHRARHPGYVLLFHDTHHRSVTAPQSMSEFDLSSYDGVLAFGASIAEVYRKQGWAKRVWVWHEAAHLPFFRPVEAVKTGDLVWIGNWGDDERASEIDEFVTEPVRVLHLRARIYGVRYPAGALETLRRANIDYAGWTPNFKVPEIFGRHRVTVHVPRRPYASALPGIPTIRVFEALACGIPLVSAPWDDCEGLFTPGADFLMARDGHDMKRCLRAVLQDPGLAQSLAEHGLETIVSRHSCAHRVDELLGICREISRDVGAHAGGVPN